MILAVVATTAGAALLLGSNQAAPTTVEVADLALTGPPVVGGIDLNPQAAETAGSGMHLGVLDKAAARQEQRQDAAARDVAALETFAAAQEQAVADYAVAVAAAAAAADDEPVSPSPVPVPTPNDDGNDDGNGGGGGGGGGSDSLYEMLDNIASCESGRNPDAFNPQGPWYGAFQFRRDTWVTYGGGPRDIRSYSYEVQREVAANLARARGFAGSWPTCAARYGYV